MLEYFSTILMRTGLEQPGDASSDFLLDDRGGFGNVQTFLPHVADHSQLLNLRADLTWTSGGVTHRTNRKTKGATDLAGYGKILRSSLECIRTNGAVIEFPEVFRSL